MMETNLDTNSVTLSGANLVATKVLCSIGLVVVTWYAFEYGSAIVKAVTNKISKKRIEKLLKAKSA